METTSFYHEETTLTSGFSESYNESLHHNSSVCFHLKNEPYSVAIQIVMGVSIVLLNAAVIGIIVRNSRITFRKPTFIFIIALSSADMLLALSLLIYCWIILGNYQFEATTWVNLQAIVSVSFNASVNFLLVIAVDRLIFIAYNPRYKGLMKNKSVATLIILSWIVAIIPVLPLAGDVGSCASHCICEKDTFLYCPDPSCSRAVTGFTKNFLFGLFFYFLFMVIAICALYGLLFRKVHQQGKKVAERGNERSSQNRMKREFRLIRTIGMIIVIFTVCWSPLMFLYVIDFSFSDLDLNENLAQYIIFPSILNSVMNPIIYAARIPILKKYFCRCMKSSTDTPETSATNQKNVKFGKNTKVTKFDSSSQQFESSCKKNNDITSSISRPLSSAEEELPCKEIENNNKVSLSTFRTENFIRLNDDISIAAHDRCSFIEPTNK